MNLINKILELNRGKKILIVLSVDIIIAIVSTWLSFVIRLDLLNIPNFNEIIFRIIYSAADLFLIPSKLEALGQTAIESGSCSTPSIGFKNTGVTQVIDHKENGYLSNYCDVEDLNNGVKWCIKEIGEKNNLLGQNARKKILSHFSEEIITKKYEKVYNTLINSK